MTSLASSFGLVFSTIVATALESILNILRHDLALISLDPVQTDTSKTDPAQEFHYGFWTALSYGAFAFVMAIPCLWGIEIVSFPSISSCSCRRSPQDPDEGSRLQLGKTGETHRVEELVVHHHDVEVFEKHAHEGAVSAA